jgi:DNA primase catalytic subunit
MLENTRLGFINIKKKCSGGEGYRVKIKKNHITPATGKERGDLEIKDYVVMQNLNLKLNVSLLLTL